MNLIHMNGRVYDPVLGRFLSADPQIQDPTNSQSLNRYTYCMNNPLAFTDPTGYGVLNDLWHDISHMIGAILSDQTVQMGIGIALTAFAMVHPELLGLATKWLAGAYVASAYSGVTTVANGGSISQALEETAITFATAAVWHGVGDMLGEDPVSVAAGNEADLPTRVAVHGLVGGGIQAAEGGNFADGFLSAAAAEATPLNKIGTDLSKTSVVAGRSIAAGIVGGTVASATGGDFINGAKTAAFAEMFNDEAHLLAEAEKATANFFVGVGDGATFGATAYGRPAGTIDTNSWSYRLGHFFGGGAIMYLGGEGGIALGKMAFSLRTEEVVGEGEATFDAATDHVVGEKITGYTQHGLNQAISRDMGRGVSSKAILETLKSPNDIVEQANGVMKYIGDRATVILNKSGRVITTYGEPRL
ncbi:MAG: RHS repeat-associated core domain-containing protein [Gammaproteobacteria bacterium]|nr:RHS repeat-associated core domain-containing protein [Gammaproteobacteria bacterium]MBU2546718.1 RHS repeat-associated core domain-containing protein [Gammaproteobacteria bacterium]